MRKVWAFSALFMFAASAAFADQATAIKTCSNPLNCTVVRNDTFTIGVLQKVDFTYEDPGVGSNPTGILLKKNKDESVNLPNCTPAPCGGKVELKAGSYKFDIDQMAPGKYTIKFDLKPATMTIDSLLLDYKEVELGFSFTKAIVVRNVGDEVLTIKLTQLCDNPPCKPADPEQFSPNIGGPFNIAPNELQTFPQIYKPTAIAGHTIQIRVESNDPKNASQIVTLTGKGVSPAPIDSVLALDRSGSMSEPSGANRKIDLLIDAASLFVELLRVGTAPNASDGIGLVRYNHVPEPYLELAPLVGTTHLEKARKALNPAAAAPAGPLDPAGMTAIGGAMKSAASMFKVSQERKRVLVVLTDGIETAEPYAKAVASEIVTADPELAIYAIGLGDSIDTAGLQAVSNGTTGRFFATADLSGVHRFDLETFYFKIFTHAIGTEMVVDPTTPVALNGSDPIVIGTARLTSSDRSATFLVLDEPELRDYYALELIDPSGKVIAVDSSVSGITVHVARRNHYAIYRVQMPDVASAPLYTGDWTLRLTPNGTWSPQPIRPTETNPTFINPFDGIAPIAFAVAAGSDYRMETSATSTTTLPGAVVTLTATFTDRGAESKGKSVIVTATLPDATEIAGIALSDDGTNGDAAAGDGTWTTRFTNTSASGAYQFLFRGVGENHLGEMVPREDARWVALAAPRARAGCGNDCPGRSPRTIWWSFHLGYNAPAGSMRNVYDAGFGATIDAEVPLAPRWAAYVMLGHHEFPGHTGPSLRVANLSLNLRRYFSGTTRPWFVELGPGIYRQSGGFTGAGVNAGAGILVPVLPKIGVELAGNMHAMNATEWMFFCDATLGVRFRF